MKLTGFLGLRLFRSSFHVIGCVSVGWRDCRQCNRSKANRCPTLGNRSAATNNDRDEKAHAPLRLSRGVAHY